MPKKRINPAHGKCRLGMTFTEVLMAAAILAFAMVPLLKAMTGNYLYSTRLERTSQSLLLAQNQLERLRAGALMDDFDSSWSESNKNLGSGYYGRITADSDSALRTVTVEVGFDADEDSHLDNHEVLITLRTKIAKLQ